MSERRRRMYAESVSGTIVQLEAELNDRQTGIGIQSLTVETIEATAEAGFWGTTGSCGVYEVIIRKVQ